MRRYRTAPWLFTIIMAHLTSPLAVVWYVLTRNDLHLEIGTLVYSIRRRRQGGSNSTSFGGFMMRRDTKGAPRHISFDNRGGRMRLYERKAVRLFPPCKDAHLLYRSPVRSASHSVGPVEITIAICDPKQPSIREQFSIRELLKSAQMPVYGPAGSPFGLQYVGAGSGNDAHGARSISLHFANSPNSNEEPQRTAEYLDQVRRRASEPEKIWPEEAVRDFDKELKRIGIDSTHDQIFRRSNAQPLPEQPPVPTVALDLASSAIPEDDAASAEFARQIEQFHMAHRWEDQPFGRILFDNLPATVREQLSEYECRVLCSKLDPMLNRYAPDLVGEIATSGARITNSSLLIDGVQFDGQLLCWPHARPLCAFELTQAQVENEPAAVRLDGASFGIEYNDLVSLLEHLARIDKRPDITGAYQAQADEAQEQSRARWKAAM